jgi:hypothetical protein
MEARPLNASSYLAALLAVLSLAFAPAVASGASARSQNFIVSASTPALAQEICESAENYRRDLAIEWLGAELPPWRQPCPIEAQVHPQLGAGGATQFSFSRQGMPFGWSMSVQGSKERVLDSVLPHEVTHTIFASHFGRPLPRWADEGACTTVEHNSEKHKQDRFLIEFLMTERGIPFNKMFAMKEYPPDMLPLYAQGYSLARYLIMQGGKRKYVQYVGEGMQSENWPAVTRKYYGHKDLSDLQVTWLEWVRMGSPKLQPVDGIESRGDRMIAATPATNTQAANPNEQMVSNTPASVVASPVTNVVPQAQVAPVPIRSQVPAHALVAKDHHTPTMRQPSHMKNLETVSPPRPEFATGVQIDARPASTAARPYSEGWYAKTAKQQQDLKPSGPPTSQAQPAAYSQPQSAAEVAPLRGANGSSNLPAAAPPGNRRVMLEWSRPVDQPWNPAADSAVARAPEATALRDLAADSSGTMLR